MYSVQFKNGKFLGLNMNRNFIYAHNQEFRRTFDSIEEIEKAQRFFCNELKESVFFIVDKNLETIQKNIVVISC